MKDLHWKIIAGLLVVILALSAILYYRGFREPTANPYAPSFIDSIRESRLRADRIDDIINKHHPDYEGKLDGYRASINPDSAERSRIGAEIYANAVRKADSLRKRAP